MRMRFERRMSPASRKSVIMLKDDDDIYLLRMSLVVTSSENGLRHCWFSGVSFKKEKCLRAEYDFR